MTWLARHRVALAGVAAVLVIAGLAVALAAALLRPAPAPAAEASPAPTATPAPSPPAPVANDPRQHQEYRAYVSTVVQGSAAVLASMAGLAGCRTSREQCVVRLGQAGDQAAAFRGNLATSSPPSCLAAAHERLQDALSFLQSGLDMARDAVGSENRVRMVQGLLMVAAGLWRGGQAIGAGRHADCE